MLYTDLVVDEMRNIFESKDYQMKMKRSNSFDFRRREKLPWKLERRHSVDSSDYKSDISDDSRYSEFIQDEDK